MIEADLARLEGALDVRDLIEAGGFGFGREVVSTSHLFEALAPSLEDGYSLAPKTQTKILECLGYVRCGRLQIPQHGMGYRQTTIWAKTAMPPRRAWDLADKSQ